MAYWTTGGFDGWWQRGKGRKKSKPYTVCGACGVGWAYKPEGKECWHCGVIFSAKAGFAEEAEGAAPALPPGTEALFDAMPEGDAFKGALAEMFPLLVAQKPQNDKEDVPTEAAANKALNAAEQKYKAAANRIAQLGEALAKYAVRDSARLLNATLPSP